MYENFYEKRSNNRLTTISTPIMRPPPGTMLLLAALLVIVSTVQANGKTLLLEPVSLWDIWDNAWKSKYFDTYKTISLDCYTGKAATKKMKIVTSMKRIRTWEDCREKCNTKSWCDFFHFKVSLSYF